MVRCVFVEGFLEKKNMCLNCTKQACKTVDLVINLNIECESQGIASSSTDLFSAFVKICVYECFLFIYSLKSITHELNEIFTV